MGLSRLLMCRVAQQCFCHDGVLSLPELPQIKAGRFVRVWVPVMSKVLALILITVLYFKLSAYSMVLPSLDDLVYA